MADRGSVVGTGGAAIKVTSGGLFAHSFSARVSSRKRALVGALCNVRVLSVTAPGEPPGRPTLPLSRSRSPLLVCGGNSDEEPAPLLLVAMTARAEFRNEGRFGDRAFPSAALEEKQRAAGRSSSCRLATARCRTMRTPLLPSLKRSIPPSSPKIKINNFEMVPDGIASPAPPAHGDGGCQHAPALTEGAGALIVSVPLLMQHEDPMGATRPPRS